VAFFSLEMSKEQVTNRLISALARVDLADVRDRRFSDAEASRVMQAAGEISEWPIHVEESGYLTISELRNRALALAGRHKLDLVVVDYIGYVNAPGANLVEKISNVTRGLKALAKELHVPVIALSQLSRAVEKEGREPQLSDLRDSGSIEQDGNIIIFLHRSDPTQDTTRKVIVAKNRDGKTGAVHVAWQGSTQRFSGLDIRRVA
jgi:replicative DNA helicase